jgi:hypothetical protein
MGLASTILTVALLAAPPVEISTFSGGEHKGELSALADGQLTLTEEGEEKKLPLDDVLELRLEAKSESVDANAHEVLLTDGSRLNCSQLTSTDKLFSLEHPTLGKVEIPAEFVSSIRLAPPANTVAEAWNELTQRRDNSDMLVIRKDSLLDHIKGGVGPISETKVQFFLGGQQNPIDRSKLYGVILGNRKVPNARPISRAILSNNDSVELKSLSWTGEAFEGEMLSGTKITLPADKLASLDFSLGKVQFLSDITPRKNKTELPFYFANEPIPEIDLEYYGVKINKNFSGKPLQLGKTVYARGLCIHPKTELAYRLSKEMRRFQAMMGIDNVVAQRGLGDVKVTILGDGKTLLEELVKAGDEPRKVDLDVTGVVVLEIIVDRAREDDLGVGDHLNLADAKLIK